MITIDIPEESTAGKALAALSAGLKADPSTICSLLLELSCSERRANGPAAMQPMDTAARKALPSPEIPTK